MDTISTVTIPLYVYNEMRDFQKQIKDGFTYRIGYTHTGYSSSFISTEEAIKEMSDVLSYLTKENERLKGQPTIDEIKDMSIWQFIKWKTKNKSSL